LACGVQLRNGILVETHLCELLCEKDFGACQTSSAHLSGRAALVPLAFRLGAAAYHILRGEPQLGGSQ